MTDETEQHDNADSLQGNGLSDLNASIVTEENGRKQWHSLFTADKTIDGYFMGKDKDGNAIVVQTREAKSHWLSQQGDELKGNRLPDLFIYLEEEEDHEKIWTEILVAWKGKKAGYYTTRNAEGQSVVIQTREAAEANLTNRHAYRMAAVDLEAQALNATDTISD